MDSKVKEYHCQQPLVDYLSPGVHLELGVGLCGVGQLKGWEE